MQDTSKSPRRYVQHDYSPKRVAAVKPAVRPVIDHLERKFLEDQAAEKRKNEKVRLALMKHNMQQRRKLDKMLQSKGEEIVNSGVLTTEPTSE